MTPKSRSTSPDCWLNAELVYILGFSTHPESSWPAFNPAVRQRSSRHRLYQQSTLTVRELESWRLRPVKDPGTDRPPTPPEERALGHSSCPPSKHTSSSTEILGQAFVKLASVKQLKEYKYKIIFVSSFLFGLYNSEPGSSSWVASELIGHPDQNFSSSISSSCF